MTLTPTVAIVGRPNVGKSTLFNRLVGRRHSIVHDKPGVTRDRITALAELETGRTVELVDTGGLTLDDDPLGLGVQVLLAVEECDLLALVVDGRDGLLPADQQVWGRLRSFGKPAVLVVNKGDTTEARDRFTEFYRLGIDPQLLVSAEHGSGIAELREALTAALPELPTHPEGAPPADAPPVAIVGRPNVGKSSLVNRIAGAPRSLVAEQPGTTRDPVDTVIERGDRRYLLIDTAGIRRRSRTADAPEELAVMMSRRQIERCRVAVLVIDAAAGVTSGDLAIGGAAWEIGRGAVVAVNKWDLVDQEARERLEASWPRLDQLLSAPLRVNVSATSGRSVEKLFPAIDATLEAFEIRLPTAEVNRLFEEAVKRVRPPSQQGRPWKLYYATQVGTGPPTFMLFANRTLGRNDSYRRYLENQLRERHALRGVPVRLVIRKRGG
jgi:GTP-binding protein